MTLYLTAMATLWLLCGVGAAVIAHRRRLNVAAAFVVGAVFGVLGLGAVASAYPSGITHAAAQAVLR